MKKQKTSKKDISKAKATKKTTLSSKPPKPKKKTLTKKASETKKAVTPKKAIKKTTVKKIKAVPNKPEKEVKTEKAKTAKKKTVKKTVAKAAPKKPMKKAAVKKTIAKKAPEKRVVRKPLLKKAEKLTEKEIKKPLEELTIAELKTLAKELDIALKSGLKKADIIKAISKTKAEKKPMLEKPKKKVAKKEKVVATKKAVKRVAVAKKPFGKPPEASEEPLKAVEIPAEMPPLPIGYGENKLASMPVTPRQVYAYWEITEDTISKYEGSLNLKVINTKTNAFFYTPISERIGEQFISVSPAAEYTVELGVINYKGEFVRILKSLPVETPVSGMTTKEAKEEKEAEGTELPEEFFETPESISSY